MEFTLLRASRDDKPVITNLMQFYIYDFSAFMPLDVEPDGQFAAYPDLDSYWKDDPQKFAYIIRQNGNYAGFVLVKFIEKESGSHFSIAEFFVMKKYRLLGAGKSIAAKVFDLHRGKWEVFQWETNQPARIFWNKVIETYTNGRFTSVFEAGKWIQRFEN